MFLLVQHSLNLGIIDVGFVVPVEARVNRLGQAFTLGSLDGGFHTFVTNADRVLGDGARFRAGANCVQLLLARIITNHDQLSFHTQFLHAIQHADDRAFVGAEEALQVRVSLDNGFGQVCRFELVAATVLGIYDLDIGILASHFIGEALNAVDTGPAGLVVGDDRNFAFATDQFSHLIGRHGSRGDVVGGGSGHRNVTVYARVEANHGNIGGLGFFQQGLKSLRVNCRETNGSWVLVQGGLEHFHLLVDHGFGLRAFEGDVDIQIGSGLFRAFLHRLPELVMEALGNHGNVRLPGGLLGRSRGGGFRGAAYKHRNYHERAQ